MDSNRFKELLDELDGNSLQTLKEKNARYAQNGDALHNFRKGAAINRNTLAQTCWGYMSKHLVALQDKVESNDFSNREDLLEKCQDTINYIRFLWCIGNEDRAVEEKPEKKWKHALTFINYSTARDFIEHMDKIRLEHGVISEADIQKYTGNQYEQSDYHIGWNSTRNWDIEEAIDRDGKPSLSVVRIPNPVNI